MKIACCLSCKIVISAGDLPNEVTVKSKDGSKKVIPYPYKHAFSNGGLRVIHEAVLKDLPDTPQNHGESPGEYLKRLWEIYATK